MTVSLVLYDIKARRVVLTYIFPETVVDRTLSFLNDIVVDTPRGFAYISDAGTGAVIVYDRYRGLSRRYAGPSTQRDPSVVFTILGVEYRDIHIPIDGIALSTDTNTLVTNYF